MHTVSGWDGRDIHGVIGPTASDQDLSVHRTHKADVPYRSVPGRYREHKREDAALRRRLAKMGAEPRRIGSGLEVLRKRPSDVVLSVGQRDGHGVLGQPIERRGLVGAPRSEL